MKKKKLRYIANVSGLTDNLSNIAIRTVPKINATGICWSMPLENFVMATPFTFYHLVFNNLLNDFIGLGATHEVMCH